MCEKKNNSLIKVKNKNQNLDFKRIMNKKRYENRMINLKLLTDKTIRAADKRHI